MLFVRSFRQFTGARRALRLPLCGVPDGRGGAEGVAAGVLRDEPLHRVDAPHGRQSGTCIAVSPPQVIDWKKLDRDMNVVVVVVSSRLSVGVDVESSGLCTCACVVGD